MWRGDNAVLKLRLKYLSRLTRLRLFLAKHLPCLSFLPKGRDFIARYRSYNLSKAVNTMFEELLETPEETAARKQGGATKIAQ